MLLRSEDIDYTPLVCLVRDWGGGGAHKLNSQTFPWFSLHSSGRTVKVMWLRSPKPALATLWLKEGGVYEGLPMRACDLPRCINKRTPQISPSVWQPKPTTHDKELCAPPVFGSDTVARCMQGTLLIHHQGDRGPDKAWIPLHVTQSMSFH